MCATLYCGIAVILRSCTALRDAPHISFVSYNLLLYWMVVYICLYDASGTNKTLIDAMQHFWRRWCLFAPYDMPHLGLFQMPPTRSVIYTTHRAMFTQYTQIYGRYSRTQLRVLVPVRYTVLLISTVFLRTDTHHLCRYFAQIVCSIKHRLFLDKHKIPHAWTNRFIQHLFVHRIITTDNIFIRSSNNLPLTSSSVYLL